jgi:hypothetical protein
MKLKLKPRGTERLKLMCDTLLSTFAFKINLRRYIEVAMREEYDRMMPALDAFAAQPGKAVQFQATSAPIEPRWDSAIEIEL